jgi:hypothetical protein
MGSGSRSSYEVWLSSEDDGTSERECLVKRYPVDLNSLMIESIVS